MENDFVRRQCSAAAVLAARRSSELKSANNNNNNNNKNNDKIKSSHLYGAEMLTALRQDMAGKDVLVDDKESYVGFT